MATPIHHCANLDRALAFYLDLLGATLVFRAPGDSDPAYAAVRWQGHELHLSSHSGDGASGAATVVRVDDVDAVFADLRARGYEPPGDRGPVFAGPCDQSWGTRELYVRDPDGNTLRFTAGGGAAGAP